jgi:transcriptional regulator NrdR family protein
MKCPFCHSQDNRVIDTRKFDTVIIRLRLCMNCKMGWHTEELIQATHIEKIIDLQLKCNS